MDKMNKECTYDFSHARRGIALLIHNEEYDPTSRFNNRPEDNEDLKHMLEIFKELEFDVHPHRNLKSSDISNRAKEVSEMKDMHKKPDCFVCVIAAHGEEIQEAKSTMTEHVIFGTDGFPIQTREIVEMFDENNCEELVDKPNFFFIQACRGRTSVGAKFGMDKGHNVSITERRPEPVKTIDGVLNSHIDGRGTESVDIKHVSRIENAHSDISYTKPLDNFDTGHMSGEICTNTRQLVHQSIDIECPADTFLMFASLSSNYAARTRETVGWLIKSLYKQIREDIDTGKIYSKEFTQVLNDALQKLSKRNFQSENPKFNGAFSPGCFIHCLIADVFFNKKP